MENASAVFLTASIMFTFVCVPMLMTIWRLKEENRIYKSNEEYRIQKKMIHDKVVMEVTKAYKSTGTIATDDENIDHLRAKFAEGRRLSKELSIEFEKLLDEWEKKSRKSKL